MTTIGEIPGGLVPYTAGQDPFGLASLAGTNRSRTTWPRRVVITGMGVVTALGETLERFWSGFCEGRSGIGRLTRFDASRLPVKIGGEVKDFDPDAELGAREARRLDRFLQFALAAIGRAIADSGLPLEACSASRRGAIVGSGKATPAGHNRIQGGPRP